MERSDKLLLIANRKSHNARKKRITKKKNVCVCRTHACAYMQMCTYIHSYARACVCVTLKFVYSFCTICYKNNEFFYIIVFNSFHSVHSEITYL